jgi:signal transduction histidine kinase
MRGWIDRLLPRRIAAQSAAVVLASVVLIHLAITLQFRLQEHRSDDRRPDFVHAPTIVRLIAASEPGEARRRLVADTAKTFPALELVLSRDPPTGDTGPGEPADRPRFGGPFDDFGPALRVVQLDAAGRAAAPPPPGAFAAGFAGPPGPPGPRRFAVGLTGGDWLTISDRPPPPPPLPLRLGPWGTSLIFVALSSTLLGLWAARGLVGPLRALAAAARDFDIEADPKPLPQRGPEEVRVAAAAFEAMRLRIRSLVEDRTRMLAAMGHDLRTPLTRLRLRSEFVGDPALEAEMQRDLAGMSEMIDGALTYLAEGRHREAPALVDLTATLETICDGWADLGRDVVYEGPPHLLRRVRPLAIERALANLVDNALKYGTRCVVRLAEAADGGAVIEVEDDGPGIDPAEREAMLRPFVRGDAARNMDDHRGFGLGLAIVKAVVDGHHGRIDFDDVRPHGLLVRLSLPAEIDGAI